MIRGSRLRDQTLHPRLRIAVKKKVSAVCFSSEVECVFGYIYIYIEKSYIFLSSVDFVLTHIDWMYSNVKVVSTSVLELQLVAAPRT